MRNIKNIAILVCLLCLAASCNEQLDLQTDGRISRDDIFKNRNNVRGYLNSIYHTATPELHISHSSYSDESEPAELNTGGVSKYINWYNGVVSATSFPIYSKDGNPWSDYFAGIRRCNTFLAGIGDYDGLAYGNEKSNWEAQARVLRAFFYLQLIKRYGCVPYVTEEITPDRDASKDRKSSFSQVAFNIIEECRLALEAPDNGTENSFSWQIHDTERFGIMHRAVAWAIMSEAALYAASPLYNDGTITWQDAAEICGQALYECLQHDYELFTTHPMDNVAHDAYAYYFLISANDRRSVDKETIHQYSSNFAVWQNSGLPTTGGQMSAGYCPTQNLVDSYEMQATGQMPITGYSDADKTVPIVNTASGYDPDDPYTGRDPRFYGSIYFNGAPRYLNNPGGAKVDIFEGGADGIQSSDRHTRTGYYLRKMNDYRSSESGNYDGALRSYRLAGLYLNFAEAAYNALQNGYTPMQIGPGISMSAADAINTVRERAAMPPLPTGLSVAEFENRYRNERRVELAFEGHRYYDVRRWMILDRTDEKITGMRITRNPDQSFNYQRFLVNERACIGEKFLLYPIIESEVQKIKNITGEDWQNPGW